MMRTLPNGQTRFCYGLATLALVASGIAGAIVASYFGDETSQKMVLWTAAAIGGNLGPLAVDIVRRVTHF